MLHYFSLKKTHYICICQSRTSLLSETSGQYISETPQKKVKIRSPNQGLGLIQCRKNVVLGVLPESKKSCSVFLV